MENDNPSCTAHRLIGLPLAAAFFFFAGWDARADALRSPVELKNLTLEELLQTKVISATRTLEKWNTTPAAISVIPEEMIHDSGATRLPEVLRAAPGLNVARYVGSSYAISSRGFSSSSSNKLQVMMDGRSLYTPLFSGVFWEIQDTLLEDLDRVEVVRGPGAALWGSNAVNGVINFVTKSARETQGGLVVGAFGNEERSLAAVRYGGKAGSSTYYRTYFKFQERDEQIFANGQPARDGMRQTQGGFRIDSTPSSENLLTFQGDLYENTFGINGRPDARNSGGNLLGRWTHTFSPDAELQVQTYYDRGRRDVPLQFQEKRSTYDLDVQHRFKAGDRHSFVVGGGYRTSRDETGQGGRTFIFSPRSRSLDLTRFFAQDQIALLPDKLALTFGALAERNDYSGWEVQPSIRLSWTPDPRQFVWAAVSRAVRAPTRSDTEARFLPNPSNGFVLIAGSPTFKSEKVRVYELGYRFRPRPRWFFDVATFYNDYTDLRTLEPSAVTVFPLLVMNERDGSTYGAEATVTVQPADRWQMSGSVSHLEQHLRLRAGSRDSTGGSIEGNDPAWQGSFRSSFMFNHGVQIDLTARHVAALPNPAVPAYFTMDLRLAFRPAPNWEISIVGQNLLEPSHPEFNPANEIQRGGYLRLTYRFP
ncbi:MAG: TonB-dependent receptor [Opitutaceae bacterium]